MWSISASFSLSNKFSYTFPPDRETKDKGVTNLKQIKDQDYGELEKKLVEIFISNLNS